MTTMMFARGAVLAAACVLAPSAASADVFMKVTGTPGEAGAKGFEQQIVLNGASLSISSYPNHGPDGQTVERSTMVAPVLVTKSPDRSSPRLALAAIEGSKLGSIEITFTEQVGRSRNQTVKSRWILEGAEVRSFSVYPGATPAESPTENVEIAYESMRYQVMTPSTEGLSGAMEEVTWITPDPVLDGWQEGCG